MLLLGRYPTASADGELIVEMPAKGKSDSVEVNARVVLGVVISNGAAFETPPPGAGFQTVTGIVPATSKSAAGSRAVSFVALTTVVCRAAPFQIMFAPGAKPAPFTVSVSPALPGRADAGTNGLFKNGTGLVCAKSGGQNANIRNIKIPRTTEMRIDTPRSIISTAKTIS